ncbi:hypothetical protein MBM_03570 [Drepanopeziza brunnea f. sp. 'multigermtubi' MB_m1]|uniref:Uncharacterized protein n=1 Tax=Marssonina brunnea f. sp. multigermtubi (strain MB_m1) TaxID=1072389 RepID=K1X0S9_MARBU|nr:uncharacterized protein MBM_03570 [Drepanopeziza brunnea f. sp. 'multigermtubi' MB_m1]EKD18577.1 hypothetical protein MBM_03570 [Drepanopeziza brunnea f. sp. 'multigermtubi' MB_m1]
MVHDSGSGSGSSSGSSSASSGSGSSSGSSSASSGSGSSSGSSSCAFIATTYLPISRSNYPDGAVDEGSAAAGPDIDSYVKSSRVK